MQDREYIYFTEVKNIPVTDLKTIDNLWTTHSDGNFGYSVQRNIWKREKEQWGKFFKKLDWTVGTPPSLPKHPFLDTSVNHPSLVIHRVSEQGMGAVPTLKIQNRAVR